MPRTINNIINKFKNFKKPTIPQAIVAGLILGLLYGWIRSHFPR